MSDDRTAPMDQPDWSRRKVDPDEQKTVFSDQESVTPPTIRVGDEGLGDWGERAGFQRTTPHRTIPHRRAPQANRPTARRGHHRPESRPRP